MTPNPYEAPKEVGYGQPAVPRKALLDNPLYALAVVLIFFIAASGGLVLYIVLE